MRYVVVALRTPLDKEKATATLERYCSRVYSVYAPRAWFVEFDGSVNELADYLWPDEDLTSRGFDVGYIAGAKPNGNGLVARSLWDWMKREKL